MSLWSSASLAARRSRLAVLELAGNNNSTRVPQVGV